MGRLRGTRLLASLRAHRPRGPWLFLVVLSTLLAGCAALSVVGSASTWGLLLLLAGGAWLAACSDHSREEGDVLQDVPNDASGDVPSSDAPDDGPDTAPDAIADTAAPDVDAVVPGPDRDGDGLADLDDNCPYVANPAQEDVDLDGFGDACALPPISPCCPPPCHLDADGDGVPDVLDSCPFVSDPSLADSDGDGVGDVCDVSDDEDGDGVPDAIDNCPRVANPDQANTSGTGPSCDTLGDACDVLDSCLTPCGEPCSYDADGDGLVGGWRESTGMCGAASDDNCPFVANPQQLDSDGDGVGDACDNCPDLPNVDQWDADDDGVGDACDGRETGQLVEPAGDTRLAAASRGRNTARAAALHRLLIDGVVTPSVFLDVFPGEPDAARSALAEALRQRFVQQGVLPS